MFSASPAAAPNNSNTTPAASGGLYKGIGSSPPHSSGAGSSSGSSNGGGGGGGMGFLYNAGGGRRATGGLFGLGRGGGSGAAGAGVDEDFAPQSAFQRLCSCLSLATKAAGAATMAVNALLFLAAISVTSTTTLSSTTSGSGSGASSISDQEQPEFSWSPFSAEALIRFYSIGFGFFIFLSEAEWGPAWLRQHLAFMEVWVLRGLFVLFVGALLHYPPPSPDSTSLFGPDATTADNPSSASSDGGGYLQQCQRLVGQVLVGLGCTYLALGLLCFRLLKQRQLSRARRRKKQAMAQEMHALHLQKHEIERLLTDTESKLQHL